MNKTNYPKEKQKDAVIALWSFIHGIASLATMKNVYYDKDWKRKITKKCGANIVGGLHLKMPDCIGDVKLLKRPLAKNKQLVKNAEIKIANAVNALKRGKPTKDGLNILDHIAGLFGQRLWFYRKTKEYTNKLKIDNSMCIGCGKCVTLCPMSNLSISKQKAISDNKCTMCYRCISHCPQKAITLLGEEVIEQCLINNYL